MSAHFSRRRFLQTAAGVAAGMTAGATASASAPLGVAILVDPDDAVASSVPARWAASELQRALSERGVTAGIYGHAAQVPAAHRRVTAAGMASPGAATALQRAGARAEAVSEGLALFEGSSGVWACGHDARGLTYALLELADRVRHADDAIAVLAVPSPVIERPANVVRSVTRLFTSEVEDKPWYNDREMWPDYLSMLATQRFNRFNLAFGIGYDFLRQVTDAYFLFAYPFLLAVPGYNVRVPQLPDAERDRNLEMLRFISDADGGARPATSSWASGCTATEWIDSPNPNYTIEGLTPETHGPYCRDAVRALLRGRVPQISGVTFRVHGESGVEEGSYDFWKTVFDGVATCGRNVEIDMHAKGMDQAMIDAALASGQPVKISPKYWAEHLGLPYHQADIRAQEWPRARRQRGPDEVQRGLAQLPALRLRRPAARGPQVGRAAPHLAGHAAPADLGRSGHRPRRTRAPSRFCGSDGVEIMEPLSFKGRRGSGIAGRPLRVRRSRRSAAVGLAEVRLQPSRVGTAALQPETRARRLAARDAPRSSARRRPTCETALATRQPHPAHRHHRARALGRQQRLLAGGVPEPLAGRRRAHGSLHRHARRPGCSAT